MQKQSGSNNVNPLRPAIYIVNLQVNKRALLVLKKSLLALLFIAAVFGGCKKDTSNSVSLTSADISSINAQLKGSWIFPVKIFAVKNNAGKSLVPDQSLPASAYDFDGSSNVNIRPDPVTIQHGTYSISTKSTGGLFVHINYPDGTSGDYLVTMLTAQTLSLSSSQPYTFNNNGVLEQAVSVTSTTLQRATPADIASNRVKVTVNNAGTYSVKISLKSNADGKVSLIDSTSAINHPYAIAFPAQSQDQLMIAVVGDMLSTSINAYADGLPINGNLLNISSNETVTSTGWTVQFP